MSDDLADYLDFDDRLAGHLDASGAITTDAVSRVQCYAVALLQGVVVPEHVHEDWPDFFPLVLAFVRVHGSASLGRLARRSAIFEGGGDEPLTDEDGLFVVSLLAETRELLAHRQP